MDRKDIEDFLRRSNSISDQAQPEIEGSANVRRMSLKEFTGLDHSKEELADLTTPPWKCSTPPSLINSFSARRRSVLATELPPSPSKKLATAKEESMDLPTAIDRVLWLQSRLHEDNILSSTSTSAENSRQHSQNLLEESRRITAAAKELADASFSSPESKWNAVVAEITDCADCLTSAALSSIATTSVYHSQLIATEVTQVLDALFAALRDAQESRDQKDDTLALRSLTQLQSTTNQLLHAISTIAATYPVAAT